MDADTIKRRRQGAWNLLKRCPTLYYGPPGVGKTTLAASYPSVGIFSFERANPFLDSAKIIAAYPYGADGWTQFKAAVASAKSILQHRKTFGIDTVDAAYEACFDWYCRENKIKHPEDGAQGRNWSLLQREFQSVMFDLMNAAMEMGVHPLFIAHARTQEVTLLSQKYSRVEPAFGAQLDRVIMRVADNCWYYGYDVAGARNVPNATNPQEQARTGRKSQDLRATSSQRLLIFNGGEEYRTKDHGGFLPAELRRVPNPPFPAILDAYAAGAGIIE